MANIKTNENKKHYLSKQTQCYLLLALPLIGFFVFSIYPILWAFAKSQTIPIPGKWRGKPSNQERSA